MLIKQIKEDLNIRRRILCLPNAWKKMCKYTQYFKNFNPPIDV